jgi:hypothetical protein
MLTGYRQHEICGKVGEGTEKYLPQLIFFSVLIFEF